MKKRGLKAKVQQAKQANFSLPAEVSSQKIFLPEGIWAYVFHHTQLGELGRLLLLPHPSGQTQFACEVAGEPDDPMTQQRQAILEPITKALLEKMEMICGKGQGSPRPYSLSKAQQVIKSEIIPCDQCGEPTAILILAPDALTADRLEDYARRMYAKVKAMNVPTWIVGAEKETMINRMPCGEALVLKVWPKREAAKVISSTVLNPQLDELMQKHCDGR